MEESRDENLGKIRKRGCSSSSSSSLVRKYRFKRTILVGKRVEFGTPKMTMSRSPVSAEGNEFLRFPARNGRDGIVSARRLAATLWEINEVSSPQVKKESSVGAEERKRELGGTWPVISSDPARSALPEVVGCRRRKNSAPESQKLLLLADRQIARDKSFSNGSLLETKTRKTRPQFKDVCKALATAKELVKVLTHIWHLEEKQSSSAKSLVSALRSELDRAGAQVDQLAYEQRSYRWEMKHVMQHLAEERAAWRAKARDKVRAAVEVVAAELEAERKLRRQSERLNRKLGRELADGKARLDTAVEELERARKAAADAGERAEVEELKKASAEAWEEVEMLQLADVLREERVQMKLADAKYHFEEKNAEFEKLRIDMEAYISNNGGTHDDDDDDDDDDDEDNEEDSPCSANSEVLRDFLRKTLGKTCQNPNVEAEEDLEEGHEDHDSSESDMHSIQLEIDGARKKSFKWSYSPASAGHDDSKRSSVEVFKGRKSLSEKIQWATISLLKGSSASKDDSATTPQPQKDQIQQGFLKPRPSDPQPGKNGPEDEIKEHRSLKSLKKQIMSSFRLGSSQGCASPAKPWGPAKHAS